MKTQFKIMALLTAVFALLMSIPYLIPHFGFVALFAIVPLLCMERIATLSGMKKFWLWHYSAFVLWNAITTFWICNATVGGAIFAILANALQMSLIFSAFRFSKKYLKGALPYIFLAVMWIAWERVYYNCQISWPWLVLGNSFAGSVASIQWYEFTGTLGGSLWIWATNLSLFGILVSLSDGSWNRFNIKANIAAIGGYAILLIGPFIASRVIYDNYKETEDPLSVIMVQPNIDPYSKFDLLNQDQQDAILLGQLRDAMEYPHDSIKVIPANPELILTPETFTNYINTDNFAESKTYRSFVSFLREHPNANIIFGASSYTFIPSDKAPSATARKYMPGMWVESHNSALITDASGRGEIFHKSKLVVGVEMTPFPGFFCKVDNLLGGVMGRDIGQKTITALHFNDYSQSPITNRDFDSLKVKRVIPIGTAICYESVYGEYCTGYVKAGAEALTVITNDAWWGNTPGYRQHLRYASLRAIETRRDIARCANTGISAIINQRGDILSESAWWQKQVLKGTINLNTKETVFVKEGDVIGKLCTFLFLLLTLAIIVRIFTYKDPEKI